MSLNMGEGDDSRNQCCHAAQGTTLHEPLVAKGYLSEENRKRKKASDIQNTGLDMN